MSDSDDLYQNIKGKFQKVRGNVKKALGDTTGGEWDNVKGATNETVSRMKQEIKHPSADSE